MNTPLSPDARRLIAKPTFFREALLTLMLQEGVGVIELSKMMGVDSQRIFRYIRLAVTGMHTKSAMTRRYPEQYLVEKMLDPEHRERLIRLHAWES